MAIPIATMCPTASYGTLNRLTSVESDPHLGRPSTSRNEEVITKVRKIVHNNRRLTVREIADNCGISMGSCNAILTDNLHMKRVCKVCATFANR